MENIVTLADECTKRIKALSKKEEEVFNVLIDYLDTLPEDFFTDNSVEELNKHFGGHDDMIVTENVRRALDAQQKCDLMLEAMGDIYDDLPEDDEDDEGEED